MEPMNRAMQSCAVVPLVSVVIPTLNRPEYLRIALQSAVGQTCSDQEIIVQDNASRIDPADVIASFSDPRIRYHRNATTLSQTGNVVSACKRARGKYLAILGDDDVWHPEFLSTLIAPLEHDPDLVLAFCDHEIIDAKGTRQDAVTQKISKSFQRHLLREGTYRPFDELALVHRSICLFSAAVLRRDAINWDSIPLDIGSGPIDHYLAYLAARTGKACFYSPRRLAQYRYHPAAQGQRKKTPGEQLESARAAMFYWQQLLKDDRLVRSRPYFRMKAGYNALLVVTSLLRCGEWRRGANELRRFWKAGDIVPSIAFYHLNYALRLHRLRA
jgi:glycosyltransferase involved in cell wall biosynthesis